MSILAALKNDTAGAHARTEEMMPSMDQLATHAGYAHALQTLEAFFRVWEPAVEKTAGLSDVIADLPARAKLPLLDADLEAIDARAVTTSLPIPSLNIPAALGALYVLEGSTLGGRVIERHVRQTLDVSPERGGSFFHGYGEGTGPMWQSFGRALEQWVATHGNTAAVVSGANACFTWLGDWLAQRPYET